MVLAALAQGEAAFQNERGLVIKQVAGPSRPAEHAERRFGGGGVLPEGGQLQRVSLYLKNTRDSE